MEVLVYCVVDEIYTDALNQLLVLHRMQVLRGAK